MWFDAGLMTPDVVWTAAKGVYARPMAEHILAMILAAARGLPDRLRARTWGTSYGRVLTGATIGVVGAGGVGTELIGLLSPFAVARSLSRATPVPCRTRKSASAQLGYIRSSVRAISSSSPLP